VRVRVFDNFQPCGDSMTFRFKNRPKNAGQKSTAFFDRQAFRDSKTNTGDTAAEVVFVPLCVMRQICDALRSDLDIFKDFPVPKPSQRHLMPRGYLDQLDDWMMRGFCKTWKRRVILEACERMCGGTLGGPRSRRSRAGE
jgi:hypothetical protein